MNGETVLKKIKSLFLFPAVMLVIWCVISMGISNPILLPTPWAVGVKMAEQAADPKLYQALAATCIRGLTGAAAAFVCGFAGATVSWFSRTAAWFLGNLCLLMQSVPNVAYIILLLFWLSRDQAVSMVGLLLVFGVVYQSFFRAMESIAERYRDVLFLYPQPKAAIVWKVFVPALRPVFSASLSSSLSLSFKAAVMAEILASAAVGLGRSMQKARLDLDAAGLIGWVLWLVAAVFVFEWLGRLLIRFVFDRL
mgnify:CR=1 FL=1